MCVNRKTEPCVLMEVSCSGAGAALLEDSGADGPVATVAGVEAAVLTTPVFPGVEELTGDEVPAGGTAGACCETAPVTGAVFFGVGNNIGVTATINAVRSRAIESLLSIYGTGSNPPGRKG